MWQVIRENIYTHRKPKVQHEDEVMVCHCELPADGGPACGPDCLNRVLNMECVPVRLYENASSMATLGFQDFSCDLSASLLPVQIERQLVASLPAMLAALHRNE